MKLRRVLDTGSVTRYHATLIDKKQTNDQHSWEVAVILRYIYPHASADLMFYALVHDSGELYTSDIAAPVKRKHPEVKRAFDQMEEEYITDVLKIRLPNINIEEQLAVKHADILSGIYFTSRRIEAGDHHAIKIRDRWVEYLGSLPYLNERVQEALEEISK